MTRPQVKRAAPVAAPADEPAETLPDIGAPGDDLQTMMSELAGSSSSNVTVYRSTKGQALAYVFKCTPDAFSLDTLRDKYNGGEFRLFISKDGVLWKNRTVYVEPKQAAGNEPPPTQTAELAAAMREGFAKQAEMMTAALRGILTAAPPPPPPSFLAGMDIPAAITALSALLNTLRPPAPPIQQNGGTDKAIDMLLKGIELAQELKAGGGDGEVSMLGILREFIKSPMLAQAVTAATAAPPAAQRPALPRPPQPATLAPPVPQPQSFASETPPSMNVMTQYLALLVKKAEEGSDPTLYADLVLDSVDEETLRSLLLRQPSAVDALIADHAPVAAHRAWFQQLVGAIMGALAPDPLEDAQLGSHDTGHNDAAGHATPSVPGGASTG